MASMLPFAASAEVFPARTFEQLCRDIAALDLPIQTGMQDSVPEPLKVFMSDAEFNADPNTYDDWGNVILNINLRMLAADNGIGTKELRDAFFSVALSVRDHFDQKDRQGSLWTFAGRHGWYAMIHLQPQQDSLDPVAKCTFAEKAPHIPERVMTAIITGGFEYTPANLPNLSETNGLNLAFFADADSLLTVSIVEDMPELTAEFPTYDGSIVLDYVIFEPTQ